MIEKITPDGNLSVIAGNGTAGHPVYGGLATATSFDLPLGMVVDPAGNVYVADALNGTIDRLTPPAPVAAAVPVTAGSPTTAPPTTTAEPVLATTAPAGSGPDEPVKPLAATLGGEVSPSTMPVTYHFQYGTNGSYGCTTPSATLPASSTGQAVHAHVGGLIPGTVYHYRLVATTPSGTSCGQDETLTTPKARLRRVRPLHPLPRHPGAVPLPAPRLDGPARRSDELGRLPVSGHGDRHGHARHPASSSTIASTSTGTAPTTARWIVLDGAVNARVVVPGVLL